MNPRILFFCLIATCFIVNCNTHKRLGIYSGFGYRYYLKPDGTFQYRYRGHLSGDTSAGHFTVSGDTIKFIYRYNNFDSMIADAKARGLQPEIDLVFRNGTAKVRRIKEGVLKRNKLYLFWKDKSHVNRRAFLTFSKD